MTLEDIWRQKSDEELIAAAAQLTDYTEDAQPVIQAEISKRGNKGMRLSEKEFRTQSLRQHWLAPGPKISNENFLFGPRYPPLILFSLTM